MNSGIEIEITLSRCLPDSIGEAVVIAGKPLPPGGEEAQEIDWQ